MATPGSFFLAPFAIGAFVAAILAFAGVSVTIEWPVFLVVSIAAPGARPVARRLDRSAVDHGVGSRRLVGPGPPCWRPSPATTSWAWSASTARNGGRSRPTARPSRSGATVRVADVQGTRVLVAVETLPAQPPEIDSRDPTPPHSSTQGAPLMEWVILLAIIAFVLFIYVLSGVKMVRPTRRAWSSSSASTRRRSSPACG